MEKGKFSSCLTISKAVFMNQPKLVEVLQVAFVRADLIMKKKKNMSFVRLTV
jgi:hypothetical protein